MSRTKALFAGSALAAATMAATAGMAAGCSSGHGSSSGGGTGSTGTPANSAAASAPNAGLSGPRLQSAFKAAVAAGTAVHVVGSVAQSGSTFSLDMNLDKNGSTEGTITQSGATIPIKVVDGVTYIQLTPQFLKQEAAVDPAITPSVINAIQNKWVSSKSAIGESLASGLAGLTGYESFLATIENGGASPSASASGPAASASASGSGGLDLATLTPAGTTTYNGKTVAVYKGADGTTAYFAASGPAYLEKVTATGAEPGTLTFTWNQPVTVTAPPPSEIFSG